MNYDLEECIKDSYDDTMKEYLESDNNKQAGWELNKIFLKLRGRLSPEEQQILDEAYNGLEAMKDAEAHEAYYRGVVLGMSQRQKVLG